MPKTRKFASYEDPKPLDKEMTSKEYEFVVQLVDEHLEPEQAFYELDEQIQRLSENVVPLRGK